MGPFETDWGLQGVKAFETSMIDPFCSPMTLARVIVDHSESSDSTLLAVSYFIFKELLLSVSEYSHVKTALEVRS